MAVKTHNTSYMALKKEDILKPIAKEKEHKRKTTFQKSEKSNLPNIVVGQKSAPQKEEAKTRIKLATTGKC